MKYRAEAALLSLSLALFASLSPGARLWWGRRLGGWWYALDGRRRRLAEENIDRALGVGPSGAAAIARKNFEHIGMNLAEFAAFDRLEELSANVTVEGLDHLTGALAGGKGAFLVSGHLGNWELTGAALSRKVPMTVVARPMKNPLSEQIIRKRRELGGMRVLGHRQSTRPILRKLRDGETITVLLDQNTSHREAVFVEFFRRPAAVNFGPVLLAIKSGAPVLIGLSVREGAGRHRAIIGSPLELAASPDRQEEVGINTARITAALEGYIRTYPEQWFWVHDRWKNRPRPGDKVYRP